MRVRPASASSLRKPLLGAAMTMAALCLAACGSGSSGGSSGSPAAGPSTGQGSTGSSSAVVTTASGALGTYLTDGSGRTLYDFAADTGTTSACYGSCATYWPPLLTTGTPAAAGRAKASLLGTTTRKDGSQQVTYGGHPLYTYAGDGAAGATSGQGVDASGGLWWVVSPAGTSVTTTTASSPGGHGRGY
ncbi:MAG TPA: hypothetical protein VMI11_13140 [Actinomycetes bacterium]|nr:hypothetical protein [Actinomycetes bacterium]